MQQVKCYNCNKIGHIEENSPEKKTRESHVDSGGGFAMVCLEDGQAPVQEPFQLVHYQQLQLNIKENLEENLEDDDLEQHLELPWSLKEWISHMNCCQHRTELVGSESWFRVVVPSDVFCSKCQAYAGSGLAI